MNVNLNSIRKRAAFAINRLTVILNSKIDSNGDIDVNVTDIQEEMNELHELILVMCCCFKEGEENFQTVYEEVEKYGGISDFNPDDAEQS